MFDLAEHLHKTVGELLNSESFTEKELSWWKAYFHIRDKESKKNA